MKHLANILTSIRMAVAIAILFVAPFSLVFYILYGAGGVSDMIVGTIARVTKSVSKFGSTFDSVADMVFLSACILKLFPFVSLPIWSLFWILIIAIVKTAIVVVIYAKKQIFVLPHTISNKITGLLLFSVPFLLGFFSNNLVILITTVVILISASIAVAQDIYLCNKLFDDVIDNA